MKKYGRTVPVALAIGFGLLTLLGLLYLPSLGDAMTSWASFLAAIALILGVINLSIVHIRRSARGNIYSIVLVISMLIMLVLSLTDFLGFTNDGVTVAFNLVQAPLEAAVASLLAFFLIFSGFRLFKRQRNGWSVLFMVTALIIFLGTTMLPQVISGVFGDINRIINGYIVSAGMRGLLIGISIGSILVALRILIGSERPYDK